MIARKPWSPWSAILVGLGALACPAEVSAQLGLPPRPPGAPTGSEVVARIVDLPLAAREDAIVEEVRRGNVPSWLRTMVPVSYRMDAPTGAVTITVRVTPDYLAIGSDADHVLLPLTAHAAQRVADLTGTSLPTTRIVDAVWREAVTRLVPEPIPPSPAMTTVPVFRDHDRVVRRQRDATAHDPGHLIAGHKKDVVLDSAAVAGGRVAIYGWHRPEGDPIQPLYTGHAGCWADYSHGVRLVAREVTIDRTPHDIADVLGDPDRVAFLHEGGRIVPARYDPDGLDSDPCDRER